MKKLYITIIIISLLAVLVSLAPKLLNLDLIRVQVAKRLSVETGWQIDAAQLNFYWLPSPNFSLEDTTITNNGIVLSLPETRVFPSWRSLVARKFELKEITLISPELQINSLKDHEGGEDFILPKANIKIDDGSVIVNEGVFAKGSHLYPLVLSGIDAKIGLSPSSIDLKLSGSSSFFNYIDVNGSFDLSARNYGFKYEINGLQAYSFLPALLGGELLPVKSTVSLQGEVAGKGLEDYKASVRGDFPCFVTPPDKDVFLLDCGKVEMAIERDGDGLMISLKELQLKNPGLILNGQIGWKKSPEDGADPIWLVDLTGKDLDLTAIRHGILSLWGDHHVTRTVSDIVLAGHARTASYYFKAPLGGFKDLKEMKIKVDVAGAEIHPPHTNLFLEDAAGVIEINNGYLSGEKLSASLFDSRGTDCSIFLDLLDRDKDFKLELDVDADLTMLPDVLHDLIRHEGFKKEVKLFNHAEGRASGHISIGDSLDNLKVSVDVGSVDGGAKYERMGWPFRLRQGSLSISPGTISWHDIKGTVGDHLVHDSVGALSWKDEISLDVISLQASVNSTQLLKDLNKNKTVSKKIKKAVSSVEGQIILKSGQFSGLLSSPGSWQYNIEAFTSGSRWTSPLLPQGVFAENAKVVLSERRIDLGDGKFWFQEQPLLISGIFDHELFSKWQGEIAISGTIRSVLAEWIKGKNWIPEAYFPRVPCTLDKLKISWSPENVLLAGGIAAGMGGISSPSVRINLEFDNDLFEIHELVVVSPEEQGKLSLKYLKKDGGKLDVNWHGFVDSVTVESLLNNNITRAERVEGDFNFKYPVPDGSRGFSGWVKISDLGWILNPQRKDILIPELKLTSHQDGAIVLEQSAVDVRGNRANLIGTLGFDPGLLSFDIYLDADKLRAGAIKNIITDLENLLNKNKDNNREQRTVENQVKGTINFKIDRIESGYGSGAPADDQDHATQKTYLISPAEGSVTVDSLNKRYTVDLRDSKLCGLDISGTFNSKTSEYESSLNIFTDSSSPPLFKDILPCLGFKDALIDGDMHLNVDLKGKADKWLSGNAELFSKQGYIHRLGFLSKAFRLVNLRDIFTKETLPDFANKGFAYSKVDITSHAKDNKLYVDKAIVDGEGLNLFGHGTIELDDWSADLTVMIAPLKTVDAVLTNIPLLGKVMGGKDKAVISIPIGLKGDLRDPEVTPLPPGAIGKGLITLIGNTLMMPFQIFSPLVQENHE